MDTDPRLAFVAARDYLGWVCDRCAWSYPARKDITPAQVQDMQREFAGHWCGDYSGPSKAPSAENNVQL